MLASRAMQRFVPAGKQATAAAAAARLLVAPRQHAAALQRTAGPSTRTYATEGGAAGGADPEVGYATPAVFNQWGVYKTKGALNVKPLKPRWSSTENGGYKMDKEGGFIFDMASSMGERRYDWPNKITIFLNPSELATIVASPQQDHQFYHDTFRGQAGRQGTMVKQLSWKPTPDGTGYYLNASQTDKRQGEEKKTSVSCSLTAAEFFIFKQLVSSSIFHMYGFDAAFTWVPDS